MPFDWMHVNHTSTPESGKRQVIDALTQQASLLRRLGYDVKYATRRCLGNLHWQFDGDSKPPIKDSEVKKLVAAVYN